MSSPRPATARVNAHPAGSAGDANARELAALNELARIATLDLELGPMVQRITDALASHFGYELVALVMTNPDGAAFTCQALTTSLATEVHIGYTRPLGTGVVGEVAATQHAVLIDDVRLHTNFVDTTPGVLSEICVPIRHNETLVGVLNIESTRLGAFNGQLPFLNTIADQIAGAIASATRYEELEQRARLMQMMSEVSRDALEATDLDGFLGRVVQYVHARFPLEIVSIRLYDRDRQEYVRAADAGRRVGNGTRWPVSEGVIGRCLRTGKTQIVPDVTEDPEYIAANENVIAELVVPIRSRNELLGVFNLESSVADVFTPANVVAFEAFADQIAGALRLLRTNDELVEAKRGLQSANERLTTMVEKFERISAHDGLTELHNRLHFDKLFPVEWRRAARTHTPMSVLIADIDWFKDYNDAHGHRAGDECLRRVARCIRDTVHRAGDIVARFGGEEFAVLLPNTDLQSARRLAETIRQRVMDLEIEHPSGCPLTISVGVATCLPEGDEQNAVALIDAADKALYAAKRAGRNRVVCADS
jgi:diguanylate cyclase (GGDEF)-like protein